MKYKYKVEVVKTGMISLGGALDDSAKQEKQLNSAGANGWQLVCTSVGKDTMKYVYCKEYDDDSLDNSTDVVDATSKKVRKERKPLKISFASTVVCFAFLAIFALLTSFFAIMSGNLIPIVCCVLSLAALGTGIYLLIKCKKDGQLIGKLAVLLIVLTVVAVVLAALALVTTGGSGSETPAG